MAIALVTSVTLANAGTTAGVNTTGANFIAIAHAQGTASPTTLTDNKGNTYTKLTIIGTGGGDIGIEYCANPTVGAGHTFTSVGNFDALVVGAFSGVATTTPFDQQNGAAGSTTGSITPTQNNELILAALVVNSPSTSTFDSGLTKIAQVTYLGANNYGCALGWLQQGSAAAINVTTSVASFTTIASFKAAASAQIFMEWLPRYG